MKIKIFVFAYDTNHRGTGAEAFARKDQLNARLLEVMRDTISSRMKSPLMLAVADTSQKLNDEQISEAWDFWEDHCREHLDTYNIDDVELDLEETQFKGVIVKLVRALDCAADTLYKIKKRDSGDLAENLSLDINNALKNIRTCIEDCLKLETDGG